MASQEIHELHEGAEHAKHDRSLAPVTLTMATLGVVIALVSLLGHRTHTEETVVQDKITDEWAYYQAKNIRRHTDQIFLDLASFVSSKDDQRAAQLLQTYKAEAERYSGDQTDLSTEARRLEGEAVVAHKKANRYDLSEALLEVGLVITSITLLSRYRVFWYGGMALGLVGLVIFATGLLIG